MVKQRVGDTFTIAQPHRSTAVIGWGLRLAACGMNPLVAHRGELRAKLRE